jgi:simple sugar transport system substrate-binding protein
MAIGVDRHIKKENWDGPELKDINNPDTSPVGFTFRKALSDADKATLQRFVTGLSDRSINLFKGPITLQDGSLHAYPVSTGSPDSAGFVCVCTPS